MRPQDVVILLKIITYNQQPWTMGEMANALLLSASEVTVSLERSRIAGLINQSKNKVNKLALSDFLNFGLKYVFPPLVGQSVRGIPTAHSASPISESIIEGKEMFVWPYYKGSKRGNSIAPLYDKIPSFIENDQFLYEYLVIVDTLRIGKAREVEIAKEELEKRFSQYGI